MISEYPASRTRIPERENISDPILNFIVDLRSFAFGDKEPR